MKTCTFGSVRKKNNTISTHQGSKFTKLKKPAKTVGPNKKACSNG